MELAEAAHREALRDIQPRPQRRPSPFPGMPDQPAPVFPRDSTFGVLFAQISRSVRQTILLEARLAAGAYDHPDPTPARAPQATPTPPPAPPTASARAPEDRPRLRPEPLEDETVADANRTPEEILTGICAELGAALQAGPSPSHDTEAGLQNTRAYPEPPPTQAERAMLAFQHGIPPPKRE